jgi:hypothetical protein
VPLLYMAELVDPNRAGSLEDQRRAFADLLVASSIRVREKALV